MPVINSMTETRTKSKQKLICGMLLSLLIISILLPLLPVEEQATFSSSYIVVEQSAATLGLPLFLTRQRQVHSYRNCYVIEFRLLFSYLHDSF
jgi:O-antigen/teichoic acid export membrane protein